ncbi:hypothetical protein GTZ89_48720 [Streptomyces sp. SID8382]|nr:hypothetical protein [Streptomyces sp. SID8382]
MPPPRGGRRADELTAKPRDVSSLTEVTIGGSACPMSPRPPWWPYRTTSGASARRGGAQDERGQIRHLPTECDSRRPRLASAMNSWVPPPESAPAGGLVT